MNIKTVRRWLMIALCTALVSSCSPYASVDIGTSFNVGPVRVNPSIGAGGFL